MGTVLPSQKPRERRLIDEAVTKLLRSADNGERLHLDADHSRALVLSRAFPILIEIQVEEMQQSWAKNPPRRRQRGASAEPEPD